MKWCSFLFRFDIMDGCRLYWDITVILRKCNTSIFESIHQNIMFPTIYRVIYHFHYRVVSVILSNLSCLLTSSTKTYWWQPSRQIHLYNLPHSRDHYRLRLSFISLYPDGIHPPLVNVCFYRLNSCYLHMHLNQILMFSLNTIATPHKGQAVLRKKSNDNYTS